MQKNSINILNVISIVFLLSPFVGAQSLDSMTEAGILDEEYLDSLPDSVREDVMDEMKKNKKTDNKNVKKRPSSKLAQNEIVRDWEEFKKNQDLLNKSERYGLRLFNTMQSSFMPLNEPNFGDNYILDYGDFITIHKYGGKRDEIFELEVERDGTIIIPDVGRVSLAGLSFSQVSDLIKKKYETAFIGADVYVTLSEIRDINVLVTGNVNFPGIYTLSGNSNILQALNIVGGPTENGSLRSIVLKRKGIPDQVIDLYEALIFGNTSSIPSLMSGDSIHVLPVESLVRAGYGFNNVATFELKNGENLSHLIKFSGGLKTEANNNSLKLVRYDNSEFSTYDVSIKNANDFDIKNLDSVYAYKEKIGTVKITGYVKHPGSYTISSSDRVLDLIERSGGYDEIAYPFAGSLFRESSKELENSFAEKTYQNLISYIATNLERVGGGAQGLSYILSELKNFEPTGRFVTEFDTSELANNIQSNIYLNDGDSIHIPPYTSNVFVFGEVGNPGSVLFEENLSLMNYINKSGGLTRISSTEFMFVVSPNGETIKVDTNGIRRFVNQEAKIYPGSVIYVPAHIGKVEGINLYATIAPIFSSLALSVASLNSINQ